jgi:acyl carrier protein
MTTEQFYRNLEEILEVDSGSITGAEQLNGLNGWDSLAILGFIAFADSKLGIAIPVKDLVECTTVQDLRRLLGEKIAD